MYDLLNSFLIHKFFRQQMFARVNKNTNPNAYKVAGE